MSKKKSIGNKLLLVSAICTLTIPSVSYAEEVILPEKFAGSSSFYNVQNTDILKSRLYPGAYKNPFNHKFISTSKETNTNIKK